MELPPDDPDRENWTPVGMLPICPFDLTKLAATICMSIVYQILGRELAGHTCHNRMLLSSRMILGLNKQVSNKAHRLAAIGCKLEVPWQLRSVGDFPC